MPRSKRETCDDYMHRLRRAAMSLPRAFIAKNVGDIQHRYQRLYDAKGGLLEEGSRGS